MSANRRSFLKIAGAGATVGLAGCTGGGDGGGGDGGDGGGGGSTGGGSPDEVIIGVCAPLSGPWSLDGQLVRKGTEFGVKKVNDNGGIDALGGAELTVEAADAGESTDTASTAAQELISNNDLTAGIGSWLSSFTISVTAVAEREQIPWLTLSFSDRIYERGFQYVFGTSPKSSGFASGGLNQLLNLADELGETVETGAIAGDNTAATSSYNEAMREVAPDNGIELVADEVWTPPLADATSLVRTLEDANPDIVFFGASATPDAIAIRRKMQELDVRLPLLANGGWVTVPPFLDSLGPDLTRNIMTSVGSHPLKGQEELIKEYSEFSGQPFMIQDGLSSYAHVHIIAEALEQTGSADPVDLRDALADINLTEGPAVDSFPVDEISFADDGHMNGATPVIAQWQDAEDADFIETDMGPFTVAPVGYEMREANWPTSG